MKVAFLGLGNMGHPMADNLIQAGYELSVWNRSEERAQGLKARVAKTPADAVREAEIVISMLADDHAVESVVFGQDGILAALPAGTVHVSMSTISVALSRRMQEAHTQHQQQYVAAPVFGRPEAAAAKKLFVLAAGAPAPIQKCEPLLAAMGQATFKMGEDPVAANIIKLSGNFLIATIIEALGETVALTRKYGVDPQAYIDFLTNTLFAAPVFKTYGGIIATQKFEPAGFKMRLGLKDIRLALAAADAKEVPIPVANVIHDHYLTGVANGMEDLDWSALAKIAALNAGLKD